MPRRQDLAGVRSPHRQGRLRKILRQIPAMFHGLALAPGDDVDGIDSGRQAEAVADGGVLSVLLADVLLVLVYEFNILAVSTLLIKNDADEIHPGGSGILKQNIE